MQTPSNSPLGLRPMLRQPAVLKIHPVHPTTLWRQCKSGLFPPPVRIGPNAVAWFQDEVEAWQASRQGTCATQAAAGEAR